MTIQPISLTIGLVESDDTASEHQNIVRTQPRKSEELNHQDMVENYVVEQERRTSGKTNSHILSDIENSVNSTPHHLSKDSPSTEIASVRSEIAQIQSAIQSVKKEMEEIQKLKSATNTPAHHVHVSRPPSSNSNKTYVYEPDDEVDEADDGDTKSHNVEIEEIIEVGPSPQKLRPTTAKSILKNESPFKRIATPTPQDVTNDDHSLNSPYDNNIEIQIDDEHDHEHDDTEDVSENIHYETDEVEQSSNLLDPLVMIRTDSAMTVSGENILEYDDENIGEAIKSPFQPEIRIKVQQQTPQKANRPHVLKRSHKTTPIKNSMPNIHQSPTVVIRAPKVNSLFPPSLRRFDRPKDAVHTCFSQMESSNWEETVEVMKSLNS